jgi:hypothetical protein
MDLIPLCDELVRDVEQDPPDMRGSQVLQLNLSEQPIMADLRDTR